MVVYFWLDHPVSFPVIVQSFSTKEQRIHDVSSGGMAQLRYFGEESPTTRHDASRVACSEES
jgi:hypothetical protein